MPTLLLSLFLVNPAPLDMPRAEAYLVREDGALRIEDRYDRLDLWTSQAVTGRWVDDDGRTFLLAELSACPPAVDRRGTVTRVEAASQRVPMKRVRANADFPRGFVDAVALLAGCPIAEEPRSPRQKPRGYKNVYYWQMPTNYADIVCTFQPEGTNIWQLAAWHLAETDDYPTQMEAFEDKFLREEFKPFVKTLNSQPSTLNPQPSTLNAQPSTERTLLRADARHSIAAYPNWHFSGAEEFAVLDDLSSRGFVETLTNDFPVMRAKYAAALPTSLDGSNVLCVARIFASRDEYRDALETDGLTNMLWTAAYWSPQRRELVAYLPLGGEESLLKTIRHEAFHQYLSYATSMIPVSPWLNEGYAQYFEDESLAWPDDIPLTDENVERLALVLPGILWMDYERFYEGSDRERQVKYHLAWTVARFLERGADAVRLKPFAGLKQRYFDALIETRDMRKATAAAFKNEDLLRRFVAEWVKYWENR